MSKLYLYNYNNYYNRIFKKENTLAAYGTPIYTLTANFNYNDGVDTYHDVNYNGQDGDYLIVTDENDNIQSRWFVLENKRNRGGQHRLTLKRDLKVDLYDVWKNEDMIVHRGWPRYFSQIIFNPEGFSFNQIKQSESLLMDESFTPWYIIYLAKNCPNASGNITIGGNEDFPIQTPISESAFADGSTYTCYDNRIIFTQSNQDTPGGSLGSEDYLKYMLTGSTPNTIVQLGGIDRDYIWFDQDTNVVIRQLGTAFNNKWSTWTTDSYFGKTDDISGLDRQRLDMGSFIVKDSTNALYQVTVTKNINYFVDDTNVTSALSDAMKAAIETTSLTRTGSWGDEAFGIRYNEVTYTVKADLITTGSVNWELNFSSKQSTVDADYNIIAIPKKDIHVFKDEDLYTVKGEWSQALLESILNSTYSQGGESKPIKPYIYDIQLLPYCPYNKALSYDTDDLMGTIYLEDYEYAPQVKGLQANQSYFNTDGDDNNPICMLYVEKAQFDFDITKFYMESNGHWWTRNIDLQPYRYKQNGDIVNYKLDNECRVYRLCSPNYNGLFEFSVAKNDGVNQFNVDVTLRPQNPYIHINPNFKYMYGQDFNDCRGLICQGDFSLPIVTDQWQTYEYQNKNYQQMFNRQMENLDFTQHQERVQAGWNLAGGSVMGAGAGMLAGSKAGLPGMVIGGALGGVASLAGGIADYAMMGERQREQKDFAIDNYKYQLGNVKALAYSINKVTPLTNNNKIWPFIEMYDCTSQEKDMLFNKLKYNSFTIEKIDKLSNYGEDGVKHFFQATPIRFDSAQLPSHELNELTNELEKGVYI